MEDQKLFDKLLHAEDEAEVEEILDLAGYGITNEGAWQPLGAMENNFATVGNQQAEATAALVEKIINAIDAVLMAECHRRDINPEGEQAPSSMAEAVERFLKVRGGQLGNLDASEQTSLADNIHVVAVGEKSTPCYLIVDRGEGQTPDSFSDTFMSLNKSNKLRIPFVQGKFNSGGTGVLMFCGERNMQLIVSRRHPKSPHQPDDKSANQWGFTVVRRMKPTAGRRSSMYVYLAPSNRVPRFDAAAIKVLPEKKSTLAPKPYALELPYGTCVKLYNFRWRAKSIATTEARYELEKYLHSPCLPFRLTETRNYEANYFSTTISGVWATILSAGTGQNSKVEPGFPGYDELNLPRIGSLPYSIAVFPDSVRGRHVPHGVFFTMNGQVHGQLPADFVSRTLKYDYLKDHLLVSVDCTAMDSMVREDFFLASRDRVRRNNVYEEIVDHLKDALRNHGGLGELNAARRKKAIESAISDDKEASSLFNDLLKTDPTLASLFGVGDRLVTSTGPGPGATFVGRKFPTFFRMVKSPAGGLLKNCPVNRVCRVEFETDATNDYFKRVDCPGVIATDPPNVIEHSSLWNGKFTAQFRVPWHIKPGERVEVTITVEDIDTQRRNKPFVSRFTILAEPEVDPKPPGGNGGSHTRSPQKGKPSAPALAIPPIHETKRPDQPFKVLDIRHDDKGGFEFFLNMENSFLLTELTRAKDEDRPLIRFWFKYGLALCALGMLQEQKCASKASPQKSGDGSDVEQESEKADDLAALSHHCDGVARVIVPIIRALYRGPILST